MALILCLETTTVPCSVGLMRCGSSIGYTPLALAHASPTQSTAEALPLLCDAVLQGRSAQALSAVAVSAGPGSFTGLRLGSATAKGICQAHDLPLLAVDTLWAMASAAWHHGLRADYVLVIVPMRHQSACYAVYDKAGKALRAPTLVASLDEVAWGEILQRRLLVLGISAHLSTHKGLAEADAIFLPLWTPAAQWLFPSINQKFITTNYENLHTFTPKYLKAFVAKKKRYFS